MVSATHIYGPARIQSTPPLACPFRQVLQPFLAAATDWLPLLRLGTGGSGSLGGPAGRPDAGLHAGSAGNHCCGLPCCCALTHLLLMAFRGPRPSLPACLSLPALLNLFTCILCFNLPLLGRIATFSGLRPRTGTRNCRHGCVKAQMGKTVVMGMALSSPALLRRLLCSKVAAGSHSSGRAQGT